jgi:penicillin amidase
MSPRRTRTIGIGISVAASLGIATYLAGRRAVPSWQGTVRLRDLSEPVNVRRDRFGVPTISAANESDLFFVQGYLHAADRLFQLDLIRRLATGHLAEVVGEIAVPSDKLMRVLGFQQVCEQEAELLSPEASAQFERYAAGVTTYTRNARWRLPLEFRLLGYRPDAWKPYQSLLSGKLMALGLCGNWEAELVRAEIAAAFGEDVLSVLDDNDQSRTFQAQLDPRLLSAIREASRDAVSVFGGTGGTGSNNWVLGPRRTASGGAMLANDPHLDLSMPSVWYENLLRCPGYEARGWSIPGTPGVILGHNGKIAWGSTNSCADVQDLYVETVDNASNTYRDTDGNDKPLDVRHEEIKVRKGQAIKLDVRATRRGPLISDVVDKSIDQALSLRWDAALKPGRLTDSVFAINRASNWEEFREATKLWSCPSQNLVYADVEGNIGYQLTGEIPVRASGDGSMPRMGDDPEGDWVGVIPFDGLPTAFNPPSERIVTANDRIVNDDYPHFISREWMSGYRGERIRELIDQHDRHTVERQLSIQTDVLSLPGREIVRGMAPLSPEPKTQAGKDVWRLLQRWDFRLDTGSEGAAAYRMFLDRLQEQVFGFLGDLQAGYLGYSRTGFHGFWSLWSRSTARLAQGINENNTSLLELGQRIHAEGAKAPDSTVIGGAGVRRMERRSRTSWTPTATWKETVERALDAAGESRATGPRRRWGIQRIRFQHPLGSIGVIGSLVNRGAYECPGDPDTVWQASGFNNPLNDAAMVGPSHRTVVDLSNFDNSVGVLAGGQSGHPASPQYADQLALWRNGKHKPAPWSEAEIERHTSFRQTFTPN